MSTNLVSEFLELVTKESNSILKMKQNWIDQFRITKEYVRTVIATYECIVNRVDNVAEIGFDSPQDIWVQSDLGHALTQLQFLGIATSIKKKAGKPYVVTFHSESDLQEFFNLKPWSHEKCIAEIKMYIVQQGD